MAAASSEHTVSERREFHAHFKEVLETCCQRAEALIKGAKFDLNGAKTFVKTMRDTALRHGVRHVRHTDLEYMLMSRAFVPVRAYIDGWNNSQPQPHDPRQILVYALCALGVFPSTLQLELKEGKLVYNFSTKEASKCFGQLRVLLLYCQIRTDVEGPHNAHNFLTHQLLMLDLASLLMERTSPAVAYFVASDGFSHVRGILAELGPTNVRVNPVVKPTVLTLRRLVTASDVLRTCILVRKGFWDEAQEAGKNLGRVDALSLLPSFVVRHAFGYAALLHHRGKHRGALNRARSAFRQDVQVTAKEAIELNKLIKEVKAAADLTHVQTETLTPQDPGSADLAWLEQTHAFTNQLAQRRQSEVWENYRRKPKRHRPKRETSAPPPLQRNPPPTTQPFSAKTDLPTPAQASRTNAGSRSEDESEEEQEEEDIRGDSHTESVVDNDYEQDKSSSDETHSATSFLEAEGDENDAQTWFEKSVSAIEKGETDAEIGESIELTDQARDRIRKGGRKDEFYTELITDTDVLQNFLQQFPDKYKRCQLKLESSHRSTAKVLDSGSKFSDIRILGRSRCGRTYMDDEVVVEVLKEPVEEKRQQAGDEAIDEKDDEEVEHMAHGQVIGLLKRVNFADVEHPVLFCTLDEIEGHLVKPLCKTVPKINVKHDLKKFPSVPKHRIEIMQMTPGGDVEHKQFFTVDPANRQQYVFKVAILGWNKGNIYPKGAVLKAYLGGRNYASGLKVLTMRQRVPRLYPKDVVQNINELLQDTHLPGEETRVDLTSRRVFTIDPPKSQDLDDALSIWKRGNNIIVGVHIADVAAIVKEGSAVDKEARKRAVTFYPEDRKPHPMLPEPLSHGRCSLLAGEERLTLSVFFTFDENEEQVEDPYVKKTKIKSCRQFTYEEVQKMIDSPAASDCAIAEDLIRLHNIASKLREARFSNSMLFVPFEDPRLPFTEKDSDSVEAHWLVEEFMILTNAYIAKRLRTKFPRLMILRCHAAPTYEQLVEWQGNEGGMASLVMQLQGKRVTPETRLSFETPNSDTPYQRRDVIIQAQLWESLRRHLEHGEMDEARRIAFMDDLHPLQCLARNHWMDLMETAQYKCSYGLNQPDHFHFGLDIAYYTHFTSPIRRYADLHVHRLLHADLDSQTPSCTPDDVTRLCQLINSATARQKVFGKGCRALKIADSLQRQPLVFQTFVDKANSEQLTLLVPSLRTVPDRRQELPFSIMGVSSQPEVITDTAQNRNTVTVKWNQRFFNNNPETVPGDLADKRRTLENELESEQNKREQNWKKDSPFVMDINPHYNSVHLKHEDWAHILRVLVEQNDQLREDLLEPVRKDGLQFDYITSETGTETVSLRPCHFRMTFSSGQVLQVQMSAEPLRGVLQPRIDLVHTARNAKICTRHVRDSVLTLSQHAIRETRGHHFTNYKDYRGAWMPLLEMEAAYGAGGSDGGFVVENIVLKMKLDDNNGSPTPRFTGTFTLKSKFCFDRCIELGGESPDSLKEEESKGNGVFPLDYLCIRYRAKCSGLVVSRVQESLIPEAVDRHYTWVGHAGILSVQKLEPKKQKQARKPLSYADMINKDQRKVRDDPIHVSIVLCQASPAPPPQLLDKDGATVTLEILPKSEVDRRAQEYLTLLPVEDKQHKLRLAQAIAYGKIIPELDGDHIALGKKKVNHEVYAGNLPSNNRAQQLAIQTALTNSLSLIQGPPGTGKTYTGIKLIYLFCKINRQLEKEGKGKKTVLFCGPSNKSVDLVAKLLKLRLRGMCPKIVRMYGSAIECKDYTIPRGNVKPSRSMRDLKSDPELTDIALHHLIREHGKPNAGEIARYERFFEMCRKDPKKNKLDSEHIKAYRKLLYDASVEELQNYEVVLTTCAVGGNRKLIEGTKGSIFQVIIDECAMSPEPHSLVPIVATKAQQVVLIGDHKQLRPIITCQAAAEMGLDQSLFERLYEQYPANTVFLDTQYRMHPQICAFPSKQFYNNRLRTIFSYKFDKDEDPEFRIEPLPFWPRDPLTDEEVPHILVDVRGEEKTLTVSTDEGNEKSKWNEKEIEKVIEILVYLKEHGIELQCIKVLSQYNAQRHELEKRMKELAELRAQNFNRYDREKSEHSVTTVVSSQGGEWDYIILSTVRSLPSYKIEPHPTRGWCLQNLGFITDRNQVNVALTRAQKGIFIVGNVELLRCDEVWSCLVDRYESLGCYYDGEDFPPPLNTVRRPWERRRMPQATEEWQKVPSRSRPHHGQ